MTFETLGLSKQLLRAVHTTGYTKPTPIQAQAIPVILQGTDIMAAAQTGTGKTAGFVLPLLQQLNDKPSSKGNPMRALILVPTRELAVQVHNSVLTYGRYLQLRSTVVFGGVSINPQITKLRRGIDVLVATPGRLLDLYERKALRFNSIEILVLDEADRMLDMGFIHDIKKIMNLMPKQRQNMMFSATFSREIRKLTKSITHNPVEIDVAPRNSTVKTITQKIYPVDKARKAHLLSHLIHTQQWYQVLVFTRTKHGADKLVKQLGHDNIHAAAIHGNKSQAQRSKALTCFKRKKIQVLVATDIASRGIDIDQLSLVINFDLPTVAEDYVHRVGRTGRAGASGQAISLVSADEVKSLQDIERLIKQTIKREEIENFSPKHVVPETTLRTQLTRLHKHGSQKTKHKNIRACTASRKHSRSKTHTRQETDNTSANNGSRSVSRGKARSSSRRKRGAASNAQRSSANREEAR